MSRLTNRVHNLCMHALSSDGRFLNQGRDRSPSPQLGSIGITISDTVPSILPSAGHRRTPHPVPTFVDFDVSSFNNGQVIRILTILIRLFTIADLCTEADRVVRIRKGAPPFFVKSDATCGSELGVCVSSWSASHGPERSRWVFVVLGIRSWPWWHRVPLTWR